MSEYWLYVTIICFIVYALITTGTWTYLKYKILDDEKYLVNIGDIITIRHPDRNEEVKVKVKGRFYIGRNMYFGKIVDTNEEVTFIDQHIRKS